MLAYRPGSGITSQKGSQTVFHQVDLFDLFRGKGAVEAGEIIHQTDVVQAEEKAGSLCRFPGKLLVPPIQGAIESSVQIEFCCCVFLAAVEVFPGKENVDPLARCKSGVF